MSPTHFLYLKVSLKTGENYTTIERKALIMVYALRKCCYYLLSNKCVFYINCMVQVHLVHKTLSFQTNCSLVIKHDITVLYKNDKIHTIAFCFIRLEDFSHPQKHRIKP